MSCAAGLVYFKSIKGTASSAICCSASFPAISSSKPPVQPWQPEKAHTTARALPCATHASIICAYRSSADMFFEDFPILSLAKQHCRFRFCSKRR